MNSTRIKIKRLVAEATLPRYAHGANEDAGMDLCSVEDAVLEPGTPRMVSTGLALEIPPGFEAQIRPRSGLAIKHGVTVLNSPGTIDGDYRGEIQVILINLGQESFAVGRGMRIAQMVIAPVSRAELLLSASLSESERGAGGFGSSGV